MTDVYLNTCNTVIGWLYSWIRIVWRVS